MQVKVETETTFTTERHSVELDPDSGRPERFKRPVTVSFAAVEDSVRRFNQLMTGGFAPTPAA